MRDGAGSGSAFRGSQRSWRWVWLAASVVMLTAVGMFTVAPALAATLEDVPYLDAAGNQQTQDDVTVLDATTLGALNGTLTTGWYLVRSTVSSNTITVSGDVHLILGNNSDLTVLGVANAAGILVTPGNSLSIYAQSTDPSTMGRLTASGDANAAGIGGHGTGVRAAGIIAVNGGTVTATGGRLGAGIGGGGSGAGGTITINGGAVSATAEGGAGIGGGYNAVGGTTTINGGTVSATAGFFAAGIGGGAFNAGGTITINGGTVSASGSNDGGAGIGGGGGRAAPGGTIVITGGDVFASGGLRGGAGIGGGGGGPLDDAGGASGDITITGTAAVRTTGGPGGTGVNASGGGAGIGSGGGRGTSPAGGVGTILVDPTSTVTAQGGAGGPGCGAGAKIGSGGSCPGDGAEVEPGTTVTFHTVTIEQSPGGTITALPGGEGTSVQVPEGANQTFAITPDSGFRIVSVLVDGKDVGAVDEYTIKDVTGAHTISAVFAKLVPVLKIGKQAHGTFTQAGKGEYTITVGNGGTASTDGSAVTVRDSLPAGLHVLEMAGPGWDCTAASLTCTRSDVLDDEHSFAPITLTVAVSCEASGTLSNDATVTGGGDTVIHRATAPTTIQPSEQCATTGPPPTTGPTAPTGIFVPGPGLTGGTRRPAAPLAPLLATVALLLLAGGGWAGWRLRHTGPPRHR